APRNARQGPVPGIRRRPSRRRCARRARRQRRTRRPAPASGPRAGRGTAPADPPRPHRPPAAGPGPAAGHGMTGAAPRPGAPPRHPGTPTTTTGGGETMTGHEDGPDRAHQRPEGVSDETVEALGSLSKALETTERARGHLYSFHQLTGTADLELDRTVELLRKAGYPEWAETVRTQVLGRNVIPGHWTFQIVEAFDRTYYQPFREL